MSFKASHLLVVSTLFCSLECALILFTHPQLTWNIVMMQWWMTPARCSHEIVGGDDRGLDGCGDMVHCGWGDIPSLWCLHCKSGPRPPGMLTHDVSTPALSCGGHSTDPLLHRWAIKCLSFLLHCLTLKDQSNDQCYTGIRGGWFYYWAVSWEPFCGILSKFDLSDTIIKWQYSILGLNWSISLLF